MDLIIERMETNVRVDRDLSFWRIACRYKGLSPATCGKVRILYI